MASFTTKSSHKNHRQATSWHDNNIHHIYDLHPSPQRPRSIRWDLESPALVHEGKIAWFPKTHRWIELTPPNSTQSTEAHLYDLDKPQWSQSVAINAAKPGTNLVGVARDGTVVTTSALSTPDAEYGVNTVTLTTFRLDAPLHSRRETLVHAPVGGLVRSVQLSPDGKTLAWLMVSGANSETVIAVTSDYTGANRREIGEVQIPTGADTAYIADWYPDSKSFLLVLPSGNPDDDSYDLRQVSMR